MNVVHTLCVVKIICIANAAPAGKGEESPRLRVLGNEDDLRGKRSPYGSLYVSPCAAAASSSVVQTIAPPPVNLPPMQQYMRPYGYNDNYHRYRSVDPNESELLTFSDMNHIATENMPVGMEGNAPYYPGEPRIAAMNQYSAPHTMQTYSVFPYANPGALSVPLLFTCSPSIVQGQVVQPQPQPQYYSGYSAPEVYRDMDLQSYDTPDQVQTHPEHSASPQKPSGNDKKSQ